MLTSEQVTLVRLSGYAEDTFQTHMMQSLRGAGWLGYHTHVSRHSAGGFPDIAAIHPASGRLLFAELKRQPILKPIREVPKGRVLAKTHKPELSLLQREWLDALSAGGYETYLWIPTDDQEFMSIITKRDEPEDSWNGGQSMPTHWKNRREVLADIGIKEARIG